MASLFGDETADLFNDNLGVDDLPSCDEADAGDDGNGETQENAIKVEPKKKISRTRFKLTVDTLSGPRGIHTIENYFKDIKFKGKGNEKQDLEEVLKRLQHWGHRMYPNYKFDDVLSNIERLGKKKTLQTFMSRYRLGMLENVLTIANEMVEEGEGAEVLAEEPFDEFDALLDEQIAISKLAPRTPASSLKTIATPSTLATPSFRRDNAVMSTPYSDIHKLDTSDLAFPLAPSQPSTPSQLTSEQIARVAENRRLALERLQAKKLELERQRHLQSQMEE